jgi:hypothetical protein
MKCRSLVMRVITKDVAIRHARRPPLAFWIMLAGLNMEGILELIKLTLFFLSIYFICRGAFDNQIVPVIAGGLLFTIEVIIDVFQKDDE